MEIQWSLVLFTVISGTGAWLFAWSVIQNLLGRGEAPSKAESITAFVLLVVGGIMSVTHLQHVDRIFEALNRPTSGIFVEAALIGVLCVLVAIYYVLLVRKGSAAARKALAIATALIGVVFTFACGSSYLMDAQPVWCTPALPLAYCGTAAAAGAALNLLLKAAQKREGAEVSMAGVLCVAGSALGLVCAAAFAVACGGAVAVAEGALGWTVAEFAGLAVALGLGAVAWRKADAGLACGAVATAAAVLGAVGMRVVMWLVGSPILDFFLMPLG